MQVALFFCLAVVGHAVASPFPFNSLGRGSPFAPQDVGARADALTSNSDRVENTDQTVRAVETSQPTARFGSLFGRGEQTPPFGALLRDEASVQQGEVRPPQSNARTEPPLVDQYEQPPPPLLPPPSATERVTYNHRNGAENEGSLLSTTAGGSLQDRELPRFVRVLLLTEKDDDDDDSRDDKESRERDGFRPSRYTNLDLAAVNFDNNQRSSGHKEYITVKDNDFSGETDIYKLVGVAPSEAVRGGAASTYSAKIGPTVPIYAELDDANSYWIRNLAAAVRRATPYSAGGSVGTPLKVRTETAVSGDTFAVLLDD